MFKYLWKYNKTKLETFYATLASERWPLNSPSLLGTTLPFEVILIQKTLNTASHLQSVSQQRYFVFCKYNPLISRISPFLRHNLQNSLNRVSSVKTNSTVNFIGTGCWIRRHFHVGHKAVCPVLPYILSTYIACFWVQNIYRLCCCEKKPD